MVRTKLILFGITGDLSTRKLLPALGHILDSGECDLQVIGVSRREVNVAELLQASTARDDLADYFSIFTMDLARADDYVRLKDAVALQEDEQALIYLSVPPSAAADIVDLLGQAGLNTPQVKLLFEKPFGFDLTSAHDFLERTARYYDEAQLYRIDHYAAKDIAQEVVRRHLDGETSHRRVEAVTIMAAEEIGVEGRAGFYEQTGALRDFVQGHLMQLLAIVLMHAPDEFDVNNLSHYRLQALTLVKPADPLTSVRAQYNGYTEEVHNPGSQTETFASLFLESTDPRWEGVPLRLVTGKALDKKRSLIQVKYEEGPDVTLEDGTIPVDGRPLDAYERVLIDAINGDKMVFTTGPEVIRAWEIIQPVQTAWENDDVPLKHYVQGSTIESVEAI